MPNNLIVNQKSVRDLFQDNKTDFLIPDYQRPYLSNFIIIYFLPASIRMG